MTTSTSEYAAGDQGESMTPRGSADYAAMSGSELGTPPSFGKSAGFLEAYEVLAPAAAAEASKSFGSDDERELRTPKTPEGDELTLGGAHDGHARSGFFLPQLSQAAPAAGGLPTRSPQSKSVGSSGHGRSHTYVKQLSRESARELAKTALSLRATSIGEFTFDNPRESVRESIRRVQAYSRRETPLEYTLTTCVRHKMRKCLLRLDEESISWTRRNKIKGSVDTDDVVGAELVPGKPTMFRVHCFVKGPGTGASALRRQHRSLDFEVSKDNAEMASKWVAAIQELVRWQARAPPLSEKRRIKVVVNPHSGKRRAREIWSNDVKKFFDLGNFEYEVEETTYGGHAIDMGKSYSPDDGFEALVFIGGDGTLGEFMNGLLSRPESEWREVVATTPISLISAGTQNAFGTGVGIATTAAAVYCILKRKMRPLDVITATAAHDKDAVVQYSYCGLGWGIAGDIAAESEAHRWMGTSRYTYLKAKRSVFFPKKHTGRVRYVATDPQPTLCRYDDIRDEGALDQFEMEEGNVYDYDRTSSMARKSWGGYGGAIRSPASRNRFPESAWTEETGRYQVVGIVNIAPDGVFNHPSDGNLDLIITRKGNIFRELKLGILYLLGKEYRSSLVTYVKVKAVEIEPDEPTDAMNMDGEVLSGGPWRMEVVPSLFKALSEK